MLGGWKRLALLAAAIALPAMAAPAGWNALGTGEAEAATVDPMPFETAGENFPGSAFYYLEDQPYLPLGADATFSGAAADVALPGPVEETGELGASAKPLVVAGGYEVRRNALQCMTMAIYYEAASEPDAGQRAVAQVVLNRVAHRSYPGSVCGVVFQGSERRTGCQFSFTCDGSLARKPSRTFWDRAERVARAALAGAVYHPAGLATHYHTTYVNPYWAPKLHYLGTIGAHRFYRFPGNAGSIGAFRFAHAGLEPAARPHPRTMTPEPPSETDPVAIAAAWQQAYVGGAAKETQRAGQAAQAAPAPAPAYAAAVEQRGGERLFAGEKLPGAGAVKPEYEQSGQWLNQP